MSLLFKNYTKFKPKKDLQLQIKTVLFKRGALQQEQQQWWSNQWTLEPNIYGGGGWSPRRAVRWQSEHDAIIIVQLDRASASSAKQRKHWQESCEEYLPIKTRWNILLTASLNSQRRTVGWIPSKWIPAKKCNCSSLTSDDHSKPPSLLCVRVCWDSWIRKWRVCWMSDRIQNLMHQIGSKIFIYQTGSKRCIRLDPRYIYIRLDPRDASDWIRNPFRGTSVSPAPSLVTASAFVTSSSCHVAEAHANVKACREMWQVSWHVMMSWPVACHGVSF